MWPDAFSFRFQTQQTTIPNIPSNRRLLTTAIATVPPVPRPSPLEDRELPGGLLLGLLVFGLPGGSRDGGEREGGNKAVEGGGGEVLIEGGGAGLGGEFEGGGD